MARRVSTRGRSSLKRKLLFGSDYKDKVVPHVSHQSFDMVQDRIPVAASASQLIAKTITPSYTSGYLYSSPAPSMTNADILKMNIWDNLVRDRYLQRYRYAKLQKARFTIKWQTQNPPRAVDIGERLATYAGSSFTVTAPPIVTNYGGDPTNSIAAMTSTEVQGRLANNGLPYWQMYMLWDPEGLYTSEDEVSLRRQGIPVRKIALKPGKKVSWTVYNLVKHPRVLTDSAGTIVVAGAANTYNWGSGGTTITGPAGNYAAGGMAFLGGMATLSRPQRDLGWYPVEQFLAQGFRAAATGWRITFVPPFYNRAVQFKGEMTFAGGTAGWTYCYDLHVAGYWLFQGDKWNSVFQPQAGDDPLVPPAATAEEEEDLMPEDDIIEQEPLPEPEP